MSYYRKRYQSKPTLRTITAKYAGKCCGCGAAIPVGAMCEYLPGKGIGHLGAFSGDGDKMGACYVETCKQMAARGEASTLYPDAGRDPGFIDLDRAYEDQCSDIVGR